MGKRVFFIGILITVSSLDCLFGEHFTRLLAVGRTSQHFMQFDLQDGNSSSFPLQFNDVTGLQYDGATGRVFLSTYNYDDFENSGIFSAKLDGSDPKPLRLGLWSSCLGVDSSRGLVFYSISEPNPAINVISTFGRNDSKLTDLRSYGGSSSLGVDYVTETVYTCHGVTVFSISYHGRKEVAFLGHTAIYLMFIDSPNRILYYQDGDSLKKRYLLNGFTSTIRRRLYPHNFVVTGHVMYIGFYSRGTVRKLNLETDVIVSVGNINANYVTLCLLP